MSSSSSSRFQPSVPLNNILFRQPDLPEDGIHVSPETVLSLLSPGSTHFITDVHGQAWKLSTSHICSYCSAGYGDKPPPPGPLKCCAQCKNAWYCDKTCQKKHWKEGHKTECTELKIKKETEKRECNWKKP